MATTPQPSEGSSAWRWFPFISIAALGIVVLVNLGFIYEALHTSPGEATKDNFDTSNRYDAVLDLAAQQAALGWTVDASLQGNAPTLHLVGHDGSMLHGAVITGVAQRPLGPLHATPLNFNEGEDGLYRTAEPLSSAGQWELRMQIVYQGKTLDITRRVLVN